MVNQHDLQTLVEQLIDLLCVHLAAHRELADLLEEKEQAVIGLKLEALDGIMERERALINRIGELEAGRHELVASIGTLIGHAASGPLRLSGIVPFVSTEMADTLLDLREELRTVADRIERTTERNRTIIGHSLEHIHIFLSLLSGVDPTLKNYAAHGDAPAPAAPPPPHPAVLDRRF